MSGELRQEVTLYIGAGGDEPEYFARIEEVRDNFGLRAIGEATGGVSMAESEVVLRGDVISFTGRAWDPDGSELMWNLGVLGYGARETMQGAEIAWVWNVGEEHISETVLVVFRIDSERPYAGRIELDDQAFMKYRVLPHFARTHAHRCSSERPRRPSLPPMMAR
jgi:hypothetical protein